MRTIFTAFFTPGTRYERHADALRQSLIQYGLECDFRPAGDRGSWTANTRITAEHVCAMLAAYPGRPVLQLDADALCLGFPWLIDELAGRGVDVACHYRKGRELLNGCVYFGPTPGARQVAERYRELLAIHAGCVNEQVMLSVAIDELRDLVKVERLPAGYCFIKDLMADDLVAGEPVTFEMLQASRESRAPSVLLDSRRRRLAELRMEGIETP